ncbi:uncharacterized protein N7484_000936 [Penicillium longicatenatum]|uniref:uncharacterized protein n=1 Tax=Penicillium longicatenatum TaxID=1561947 RepID=UPI002547B020|nr:uncharacterized protein N7484_000936 [Penicillium longicatenatum]KAJ5657287.1 hypothetical protein N7484_000936 [Penicillium longicatenatum]
MNHISSLELTLPTILQNLNTQNPTSLPLQISIHNLTNTPITVLRWNTPFDPRASLLDLFEVRDTTTGRTLAADTIKISRKLPASVDDLVEIRAGETMTCDATITGLYFETGHEYSVRARGIWMAIWPRQLEDVTASQMQSLFGAESGGFESNVAVVEVK